MADYPTEYIESLHGDPIWEAIWRTIRPWDLSRDGGGKGYAAANGDDVTRIYDAIAPETAHQRKAVAELAGALDKWFKLSTGPQVSSEAYWEAWPEMRDQIISVLTKYGPLIAECRETEREC